MSSMSMALSFLLLPFAASVAFVLIHAYLGGHVLRRNIVFADLALAQLSALGATLTLPGIAGIVLTMGMAVDANVLIYERIREEFRQGRSVINAIDSGFQRAWRRSSTRT